MDGRGTRLRVGREVIPAVGILLIPAVAVVLTSVFGRRTRSRSLIASYVVLIALAVVGSLAVLFSGGFGFPPL